MYPSGSQANVVIKLPEGVWVTHDIGFDILDRRQTFRRPMNHRLFESTLTESYDRNASRYRRDDEIEARTENHQRLGGNLRRICRSFKHPIRVLEIGCGTGRYFHWLENTDLLVGTDISPEMLRLAEHPLHETDVTAREIRLIRSNLYETDFEPASFNFIYSLGVFGFGAELTPEMCAKFARWLVPGGCLYFDALEKHDPGPVVFLKRSVKRSLKPAVLPLLPRATRERIEQRTKNAVPTFNHTRDTVERLMAGAGFANFVLSSNTCHSPLWRGLHLECSAQKEL